MAQGGGQPQQAEAVLKRMEQTNGIMPTTRSFNWLLEAYARRRQPSKSSVVGPASEDLNIAGRETAAAMAAVISRMGEVGVQPNAETFELLALAMLLQQQQQQQDCDTTGSREEGWALGPALPQQRQQLTAATVRVLGRLHEWFTGLRRNKVELGDSSSNSGSAAASASTSIQSDGHRLDPVRTIDNIVTQLQAASTV